MVTLAATAGEEHEMFRSLAGYAVVAVAVVGLDGAAVATPRTVQGKPVPAIGGHGGENHTAAALATAADGVSRPTRPDTDVVHGRAASRTYGTARLAADYTCSAPILGVRPVTISGALTASPDPATVNTPTRFHLHITNMGLRSPVTINSWSVVADLGVSGAQTAVIQATGSGGVVPPRRPITGELYAGWTPLAAGVDRLRGGNVTVRANIAVLGDITVPCTPRGHRPVIKTLAVYADHRSEPYRDVSLHAPQHRPLIRHRPVWD